MKTNSKIKLFFALITLLSFVNLNAQNLIKAAEVTPAYLKIICATNGIPIKKYKEIGGVLLIDEAENHLHPKWQKLFLKNIFDNL